MRKRRRKKDLKNLDDVRKIASTSDYSKAFEHILLKWINEDISKNLSKRQFGGKKGVGTEHLIIALVDKIKKALDNPECDAAILSSYDWSGAFDRVDPTLAAIKLVKIGIRSSKIRITSTKIDISSSKVGIRSSKKIARNPSSSPVGSFNPHG